MFLFICLIIIHLERETYNKLEILAPYGVHTFLKLIYTILGDFFAKNQVFLKLNKFFS